MGIILSSATSESLDKSILNSIHKNTIDKILREELIQLKKSSNDFLNEIKVREEILKLEEMFVWGTTNAIPNISRGDTLYLASDEVGPFKFRAYITVVIESTDIASKIWKNETNKYIYFVENIQKIDIDRQKHIFSFGFSKRSDISKPIYIKDTYQVLSTCTEDEFQKFLFSGEKGIREKINQEEYIKAMKSIEKSKCFLKGIGDIVLLGTKNEESFSLTSSKSIQFLQNFFNFLISTFKTKYSHAALCVDYGLFIQASGTDKEVLYSTFSELYETKSGRRYAQYSRYKGLSQHNKTLISERSLYYVGTPYPEIKGESLNYVFTSLFNKSRPHSVNDEFFSFCSDLVMQILKHVKKKGEDESILPIDKNSKVVLPWDIDKFLSSSKNKDWKNITKKYITIKKNNNNSYVKNYHKVGEAHKSYYLNKQKELSALKRFHNIVDNNGKIPLWYRMELYHHLKKGNSGEIKEYLARKSLHDLLISEDFKDENDYKKALQKSNLNNKKFKVKPIECSKQDKNCHLSEKDKRFEECIYIDKITWNSLQKGTCTVKASLGKLKNKFKNIDGFSIDKKELLEELSRMNDFEIVEENKKSNELVLYKKLSSEPSTDDEKAKVIKEFSSVVVKYKHLLRYVLQEGGHQVYSAIKESSIFDDVDLSQYGKTPIELNYLEKCIKMVASENLDIFWGLQMSVDTKRKKKEIEWIRRKVKIGQTERTLDNNETNL